MVFYRFSAAANRLVPAAQSLALRPEGLSVACADTNPITYDAGVKMMSSSLRGARMIGSSAARMSTATAMTGEAPPQNYDPLNPGKWQIGSGGKLLPRLPVGTKVGPLVMGKYGLYHPDVKAKTDAIEEAEHHGVRMQEAVPGGVKWLNMLYGVTALCLVLSFWNLASAMFDKALPPFVNKNKQVHPD